MIEAIFECPDCKQKFRTIIPHVTLEEVVGGTITCNAPEGCGRDILIDSYSVEGEEITLNCSSLNYDGYIEV